MIICIIYVCIMHIIYALCPLWFNKKNNNIIIKNYIIIKVICTRQQTIKNNLKFKITTGTY